MTPARFIDAGLMLVLVVIIAITPARSAQPPAEAALGVFPVPAVVGMDGACDGSLIATGVLTSADHELAEGYLNVGRDFSIAMRPESPWFANVAALKGEQVEIVIRRVATRRREEVRR
jgi:hypothetical protein